MANVYDYKTLAESLRGYWANRRSMILKLWDFYYGDRQRYYLNRFEGETEGEYDNRVAGATIENHCQKTCDVIVAYMYGQPNSRNRVIARVLDKDKKIVEQAQKILQENIWRHNDIDAFRVDMALMASVTGAAIVHKEFVDKNTNLPFPKNTKKEDKKKNGTIRYDLFDTSDTMPLPLVGPDGSVYPRILGAVVRFYELDNFSGNSVLDRLLQKRYGLDEFLEVFDKDKFIRAKLQTGSSTPEVVTNVPNPYEDISIPFTIFRNYGDPMYLEGASDIAQMLSLQNTLNEISNADKTTIDYHSFPLLVLMGGAKLPNDFVRKVNSGLELDVNQDIKYLTWDNVLEASDTYKESIRKQMTVTSGVSQLSRGNAQDVGQIRSGAGLKTLFQADINTIALKVPLFRKAERALVESSLKMWEAETGEKIQEYAEIEVEFPPDFVGMDELLKAQTEQIDIANKVVSTRQVIKDKNPDLTSEAQIDQLQKEITDEAQAQLDAQTNAQVAVATVKAQSSEKKSQEQQGAK